MFICSHLLFPYIKKWVGVLQTELPTFQYSDVTPLSCRSEPARPWHPLGLWAPGHLQLQTAVWVLLQHELPGSTRHCLTLVAWIHYSTARILWISLRLGWCMLTRRYMQLQPHVTPWDINFVKFQNSSYCACAKKNFHLGMRKFLYDRFRLRCKILPNIFMA